MAQRQVFANRIHFYNSIPIGVVFRAIAEPGAWLDPVPGEVLPRVLDVEPLQRVVWSSMWPVSPEDTIEFDLSVAPQGHEPSTSMLMRWWSDQPPHERGIGFTRQRLNKQVGGDIRGWFGDPRAWRPNEYGSWQRVISLGLRD